MPDKILLIIVINTKKKNIRKSINSASCKGLAFGPGVDSKIINIAISLTKYSKGPIKGRKKNFPCWDA